MRAKLGSRAHEFYKNGEEASNKTNRVSCNDYFPSLDVLVVADADSSSGHGVPRDRRLDRRRDRADRAYDPEYESSWIMEIPRMSLVSNRTLSPRNAHILIILNRTVSRQPLAQPECYRTNWIGLRTIRSMLA